MGTFRCPREIFVSWEEKSAVLQTGFRVNIIEDEMKNKEVSIMFGFEYYTPTRVIFGKGSENRVGELIREYGVQKVLIHYGGKSAVKSGLLDRVKTVFDDNHILYVELGGVVPNPHLSKVREGIELGKREKVDFILAIGGGSVIDSAKAISYGLAEPEYDVWEIGRAHV